MKTTTDNLLDPVGAALVAARDALEGRDGAVPAEREAADANVEQALVQLACVACDAVGAWEAAQPDHGAGDVGAMAQRVTRWRGQLDDLRVQAALAEMDVRDSSADARAAIAQGASAVERVLISSVRDMSAALVAFRDSLRPKA